MKKFVVSYGWDEIICNKETSQYEYWEWDNNEGKLIFSHVLSEKDMHDEPPVLSDFEYLNALS